MNRRTLLILLAAALPAVAQAGDDKKKKTGGDSYLPIDTLTGATNKPGGRRGVMTVECGLDVPDAGLREQVQQSLPILRAAYLQTVMTYAAGLPYGAPPSVDYLANTMQRQTDSLLRRRGARFLLGAVLVN